MMFGDGEELHVNEQAKEQDLPNSEPFETVMENDMQWVVGLYINFSLVSTFFSIKLTEKSLLYQIKAKMESL